VSVRIGEVWSDVPPLPDVRTGDVDAYVRFPTRRSAERLRDHLLGARFVVTTSRDNPFLLTLPNVDPRTALHAIVDVLTPPERADTLAVLRPAGSEVVPVDRLAAIPIEQLSNRLGATWLIDLLRARDLTTVFQPIAAAGDIQTIKAYESLVRGKRLGEEVSARRLFAVAKSAYLMSQLDALAMQIALAAAAEANVKERLFVNCSPAHMYDPYTRVAEVATYARRLGLEPSHIVLEVVETERHDREQLRTFMVACKRHGFRVALDDLGSGYSSLTLLAELRPDMLKFDRSLVTSINTDPYRALIVNRLLEASRVLGLETVVEGVETAAELSWAAANGATYVQGNFIGKPEPREP
jgi:EAL domain-containing protein (putative c-di-GMP-specific phosphodiesterase class I)